MIKSVPQKHAYTSVILLAILCTFMTALGLALSQIFKLEQAIAYLVMATFVTLSALIGLFVMKLSNLSFAEYGFCNSHPGSLRKVWFYLPLALIELIPAAICGFNTELSPKLYLALGLFTISVGLNEEIYFRGLVLKILSKKGTKNAIICSSVIFGILHLANIFGGASWLYSLLQVGFAFLTGFVLAEIVCLTKSLWAAVIWHFLHDFIAYTTSNTTNTIDLIILCLQVLILLLYAKGIWVWQRNSN